MDKPYPMRVFFDKNLFVLTMIKGSDINEIEDYCKTNGLTIVEVHQTSSYYTVHAEKSNQRMKLLRKHVYEIEGWKLIKDEPTPKMHWLTYEKVSK